jgi:hypothetical protein
MTQLGVYLHAVNVLQTRTPIETFSLSQRFLRTRSCSIRYRHYRAEFK